MTKRSLEDKLEGVAALSPSSPTELVEWASRRFGVFPEESRAAIQRLVDGGRLRLNIDMKLEAAEPSSGADASVLDVFRELDPTGHPLKRSTMRHNAYVAGWTHGAVDHQPPSAYTDRLRELGVWPAYSSGLESGKADRSKAFRFAASTFKGPM